MKKLRLGLLMALALLLSAALAQATTTTVMMYMCGTDLQSYCVQDMYEMASVDLPEDVTVAVQAGGAYEWDDGDLTGGAINRFTISYDAFNDVQTYPWQNMGDKQTLYDFIDWAVDHHPADRYILVLWDHGGASGGVCYDETADYDSLTIHEVNDALYEYAERNTSFHLDIIGFDACLMATYEMAAHMAGYADYMVASEELEPGLGWNYEGWLGALAANPEMESGDIAVAIADAFMAACLDYNPNDYLSQSVINLRAMPSLKNQLETYAAYLTDALENGQMPTISRLRQRMYAFGKFSDASSDQVDFMAFLDATRQFAPNMASQLESTYRHCIYYCVGTDMFDYLTGMSLFLPGDTVADFIDTFETHYDCGENYPNYSQFVYGYATLLAGGDYNFTLQKPEQSVGAPATGLFATMQNTAFVPGGSYVAPEDAANAASPADTAFPAAPAQAPATSTWGGFGSITADAAPTQAPSTSTWGGFGNVVSGPITPDENDAEEEEESFLLDLESDYACYMTLSQDELANLSLVEGLLYLDASDEEDTILIELGAMQNAGIDWTSGDIVSGFDGTWPMLEDQLVVMYDQIRTQSMRRSIIPAMLNGTSGYLVMIFTEANPDGVIAGFTEGYDANGLAVRGLTQLQAGDELIPLYPMLYDDGSDSDEFAEDTFEGDPIPVGDTLPVFEYISLEGADSTFYYCFRLTDIFGETELSEMIDFYL